MYNEVDDLTPDWLKEAHMTGVSIYLAFSFFNYQLRLSIRLTKLFNTILNV